MLTHRCGNSCIACFHVSMLFGSLVFIGRRDLVVNDVCDFGEMLSCNG